MINVGLTQAHSNYLCVCFCGTLFLVALGHVKSVESGVYAHTAKQLNVVARISDLLLHNSLHWPFCLICDCFWVHKDSASFPLILVKYLESGSMTECTALAHRDS